MIDYEANEQYREILVDDEILNKLFSNDYKKSIVLENDEDVNNNVANDYHKRIVAQMMHLRNANF